MCFHDNPALRMSGVTQYSFLMLPLGTIRTEKGEIQFFPHAVKSSDKRMEEVSTSGAPPPSSLL